MINEPHYDQHLKLPSVRNLEAWLVAGLDPSILDPEDIDSAATLLALRPELAKTKNGRQVLDKSAKKWAQLANETAEHLTHISQVCVHLGDFFDDLNDNWR